MKYLYLLMIGGQWYAVREAVGWSSVVTSNVYFGHTTVEMFLPDSSQQLAVLAPRNVTKMLSDYETYI